MSSQSSNASAPNQTLLNGRYRLLAVVASGGMATVYKAQDILLNRLVAVKMLRERFARDPQFVQRFREEAQAAANLNHPNIVTIFDVGSDIVNGLSRQYIVMEYVEGQDLKTAIRDRAAAGKAFEMEEAVNVTRQVCEGVGYAHRRGLVHCDLKPQNVILTPDGVAKVADFGIARAYTAMVPERSDVVWGTPQYYSPEQATGAPPTPASDVYSVGVMLYEMLSGRLPFDARNSQDLARMHLNAEPAALHTLNPGVPLQLEAIVRRAMAKDPANRYRDADQLARVLAAYLQQGEEQTLYQPAVPPVSLTGRTSAARTGATQSVPGAVKPAVSNSLQPGATTGRSAPQTGNTAATAVAPEPTETGTDIFVWLLGAVAVLCMLGLIPLYAVVVRTYSSPPPVPRATPRSNFTPIVSTISSTGGLVLPSFVGMTLDQATQQITALGLQPRVAEARPDPNASEPRVLEQRPVAGSNVPKGSAVALIVARPDVTQVVPPDLAGRVLDNTLSGTLRAGGWTIVISSVFSRQPENMILAVNPPGGTRLSVSGTLTLTLSNGGIIPLNVNLSPVMLDWARFNQERYAPGQVIRFTTQWRAIGPVGNSYKVFVHVFGPDGNLVAQPPDREPQNNGVPAPTSTWKAGTVVNDTYTADLPGDAPSGMYRVEIGMYNDQGRLRVADYGDTQPSPADVNSILVQMLRVGQ